MSDLVQGEIYDASAIKGDQVDCPVLMTNLPGPGRSLSEGCIQGVFFMTCSVRNSLASKVLTRSLPNFQGLLSDSVGVL